ncbi:twin-arginine translocase TatA/TatE family subunit [Actinoplanes bogorensis]|uniref:Twin-arginine translocase TatA/TatE family subunit n=1 Tax=Paractinoplanes bogorensis TaxID=1610840 RepID=A0ABS5YVB7_9ACTN|nr:twin-arginine translocase TatA/TatE family subunit [Actinoplanes bogorensis]MBU2667276.1 twin-arginine translocase TatA/TatE family subunit [Actinoplanes bogorensis]
MRDWMIPALLILILVVFGSKRLPGMAQSLGQSLRILRRESTHDTEPDPADPAAPGAPAPAQGTTHPAVQPIQPIQPIQPEPGYSDPYPDHRARPALPAERLPSSEPTIIRRDAPGR